MKYTWCCNLSEFYISVFTLVQLGNGNIVDRTAVLIDRDAACPIFYPQILLFKHKTKLEHRERKKEQHFFTSWSFTLETREKILNFIFIQCTFSGADQYPVFPVCHCHSPSEAAVIVTASSSFSSSSSTTPSSSKLLPHQPIDPT